MAKVSFILPAFKRRFLKDAITSILAQTYCDFELVVVDDCSPEDLKSVVDEFHDERLSYHRNETNLGGKDLVAAWTHAMSFAKGEWCVLASDDDVYEPKYLERMMELVAKYPSCDLFHCRPGQIDANGVKNLIGEGRPEFESGIELVYARLVQRVRQTMPDFMFRKTRWEEIGGFVPTTKAMHSDDATWMAMAVKDGCVCAPEVLFWWRDSGVNVSMRKDNVADKIAATMMYKAWLKEFLPRLTPRNEVERMMLSLMRKKMDWLLAEHMRGDMRGLGFVAWLGVMHKIRVDPFTRNRFIYDRVGKLFNIVEWLRH